MLYKGSYESLALFGMDYNDGYEAISVIPLKDEYRQLCKKYIWYSRSSGEYTFQTPPLPEVIDCIKHQDGTLTLVVDLTYVIGK